MKPSVLPTQINNFNISYNCIHAVKITMIEYSNEYIIIYLNLYMRFLKNILGLSNLRKTKKPKVRNLYGINAHLGGVHFTTE